MKQSFSSEMEISGGSCSGIGDLIGSMHKDNAFKQLSICGLATNQFLPSVIARHSAAGMGRRLSVGFVLLEKLAAGFGPTLEIKLDLDVIWIAQKNLPTGAVRHLVHVVRDSLI